MKDEQSRLLTSAEKSSPESSRRSPSKALYPCVHFCNKGPTRSHSPLDAAVFACLTTTFYCCARLGEFTVPAREAFRSSMHVKRSNIRYEEDRHGHKVTVFALPCTKTSGKGEDMLFARQPGPTDPQDALENHLHVNIAPNESHLFSYRHRQGELVPLSRADFLGHLTCTFADAELELLQGHGIRIGATLEYLLYMRTFFRDSKANRTLEVRSIYSLSTENTHKSLRLMFKRILCFKRRFVELHHITSEFILLHLWGYSSSSSRRRPPIIWGAFAHPHTFLSSRYLTRIPGVGVIAYTFVTYTGTRVYTHCFSFSLSLYSYVVSCLCTYIR